MNLSRFALDDMAACGSALRTVARGADSMQQAADRVTRYLYDAFSDGGVSECALIRFFVTAEYGTLNARLQAFASEMTSIALLPETRCLTLLSSVGMEPDWNSVVTSRGHQAIPLPSPEAVSRFPMISQLVQQLGLDVSFVVRPPAEILLDTVQRVYNVLYVPHAKGSLVIPAQTDFVVKFGVESVLGFGGVLPNGNIFAVMMFSRVFIPESTASMFKTVALNVKMAILPLVRAPLMSAEA